MKCLSLFLLAATLLADPVLAQRLSPPPAFSGGVPGLAQTQAIAMQRHQARTLLYQEALEELRKNPNAADVPLCPEGDSAQGTLCLKRPATASAEKTSAPVTPVVRRQLAVLFGNNDYASPIPGLETPIADVEEIAAILRTQFGYDVKVLENASKTQIIATLNAIAADAKEDDSVFIFYAGHGYLLEKIDMGFWIPIDGSVKSPGNWISNQDISKLLAAIPARQLILISDSCFSGSLTREYKVDGTTVVKPEEVLKKRSVLAFSSGGDEPVSDEGKDGHSIFAWSLIKALRAVHGTTPGQTLWRSVSGGISKEYKQTPQYGAVLSAGHVEGGEYLFQMR